MAKRDYNINFITALFLIKLFFVKIIYLNNAQSNIYVLSCNMLHAKKKEIDAEGDNSFQKLVDICNKGREDILLNYESLDEEVFIFFN